MDVNRGSRRALLVRAGAVAVASLSGCASHAGTTTEPVAPHPLPEPRETTVTMSTWSDAFEEPGVRDALAQVMPEHISVTFRPYSDRDALEAAVAAELTTGQPPGTFQTVAGPELARYVTAVTLHAIPDILPERRARTFRETAIESIRVDAEPYAIPLTVDRLNAVLIRPDLFEVDDAFVRAETFTSALEDQTPSTGAGVLALPATGEWGFRLFCQLVLARSGVSAYRALAARESSVAVLRDVVAAMVELLAESTTLVRDLEAGVQRLRAGDAAVMLADGRVFRRVAAIEDIDWAIHPVPGTADTVAMDVTCCGFPKRTDTPRETAALLDALAHDSVQTALAGATHALPASEHAEVPTQLAAVDALAQALRRAETRLPAVSSGCGLDPDDRSRAIDILDPVAVTERGVEPVVSDLRGVFQ